MSLCDIRKALKQTQEDLGNKLHIGQDGISRLEKKSDMLLSILNQALPSTYSWHRLLRITSNNSIFEITK